MGKCRNLGSLKSFLGFPDSSAVKKKKKKKIHLPMQEDTRDVNSIPGSGRSPGEGNETLPLIRTSALLRAKE